LQRVTAPEQSEVCPWYTLEPQIVEEVPVWEEAVEIFQNELGSIDPKELKAFHASEWKTFPQPHNTVKIGGWPNWLQAPEHSAPLLAQVVPCEETDFFWEAAFFFFVSPQGQFEMIGQFD
jgi:hypothetical protein